MERTQVNLNELPHCPKCELFGYANDKYCVNCGQLMILSKNSLLECSICKELALHPITFYCTRCGKELKENAEE
ncbi:MAG: hypothetical protein IPP65_00790 [Chlorobi bacterium]|nr:hypothetical protein [Chlorobiota bacterium]